MDHFEKDVCIYEVKPGDSLSGIAAHFGYVTPTQLAKINKLPLFGCGLPPVFPGQKLVIPTVSRGTTSPIKVRPAPGAALRIRSLSDDQPNGSADSPHAQFVLNSDFYSSRTRNDRDSERIIDASEKQFVKLKAQRKLPSGDFVDGFLLITPDSLCFDALLTAMAQKQAYLAAHRSSVSSSFEHETVSSEPVPEEVVTPSIPSAPSPSVLDIPKELLDLGLCVPLDLLASMSTLRTIPLPNYPDLDDAISSSRAGTNGDRTSSPFQDDLDNITDTPVVVDSNETPRPQQIQEEDLLPKIRTSRSRSVCSEPSHDLDDHSPSTSVPDHHEDRHSNQGASSDQESTDMSPKHVAPAACSSPPNSLCSNGSPELMDSPSKNGDNREHIDEVGESGQPEDTLYLRLTQFAQDDQPTREHIFRIAADEIPEVLAFLLRAGVGHSRRKRLSDNSISPSNFPFDPANSSLHVMTSSMDSTGSFPRRSLVEEALESMECSSPLPVLYGGTSTILTEDMLEDLGAHFPTHWIGCNLSLVYKTEQDGYSLNTLYRKSAQVQGGVLLVIRDTMGTVFGAIMSERIHPSKHFYGTGESCVFHWAPTFQRYDWTKKNDFFMRGSATSFQIGGQSGRNAIWFDEALKYGRSEPTDTFDNPVLSGTLSALRFSSLSVADSNVEMEGNLERSTDTNSQTSAVLPATVESVPFLIDALEVWELVS